MKLPSLHEIDDLHKKYAPNKELFKSVWEHCRVVESIALQIAGNQRSVNRDLISIGALVHDIGVYRLYRNGKPSGSHYITHGLLGYELLKEEGYDESICRFALLHTGVGITKDDIKKNRLPLPKRDYVPETVEERIVAYADKFHSKSDVPAFNSVGWYTEYLRRKFGNQKVALFETMVRDFGEPELESIMKKYGQNIR